MKKMMSLLSVGLLVSVFWGGCGSRAIEDGKVQARNLTTGEMQTFSSEEEVPDGFFICGGDDCRVPPEVPCELLGAELCQLNLSCRIKIISCSGGGSDPTQPMNCVAGERTDGTEIGTCDIPVATETCEVACISNETLLCSELVDEQSCAAHPECQWEMAGDVTCACASGMVCDCPPVARFGYCVEKPTLLCANLDELTCNANPACVWYQAPCMAACPPNAECDFRCDSAGFCGEKIEPAFCETQNTEEACLASPECEWGQFICPACAFEDPATGGSPRACDCGLSCRTKQLECPAIPAIMIECPDGMLATPVFDPAGCLIGWECGGTTPGCPAIGCEMYCANGFAKDERGCEVCRCN